MRRGIKVKERGEGRIWDIINEKREERDKGWYFWGGNKEGKGKVRKRRGGS